MRDGNVLAHMEDDIWISGSNLERVRQMGMATSDEDMIYLLAFVLFCCSSFSLRGCFVYDCNGKPLSYESGDVSCRESRRPEYLANLSSR
ncbi:hypothetical protein HDV57DRAFT_274622 [Trichoderma longibrachiatum]